MAYFPNGCAGMDYEERYCVRCVHHDGPDGDSGCAIWLLHMLYNYDHVNDDEHPVRVMLNTLIPETKDGLGAEQCTLFHAKNEEEVARDTAEAQRLAEQPRKYERALAEMRA